MTSSPGETSFSFPFLRPLSLSFSPHPPHPYLPALSFSPAMGHSTPSVATGPDSDASSVTPPGHKGPYTNAEVTAATNDEQHNAGPFPEDPNRQFSFLSIM